MESVHGHAAGNATAAAMMGGATANMTAAAVGAMGVMSDPMLEMRTNCDGVVEDRAFGSHLGHAGPGALHVLWGLWMTWHTFRAYLAASRRGWRAGGGCGGGGTNPPGGGAGGGYRSRGWYEPGPARLRFLEPVLKVLIPAASLLTELWLDHPAWRYMYCPEGTKFAGRFALGHINNWQHAANYPPMIVSGIVDMATAVVPLPEATSQVFLGLALCIEAFLMGTHTKHVPLDKSVHRFLFFAMLGAGVSVLAEAGKPRSFARSCARCFFITFKGAWLWTAAALLFEHRPEWDTGYMGSNTMCPVVFAMLALTISVCMLALLVVMSVLAGRRAPSPPSPHPSSLGRDDVEYARLVGGYPGPGGSQRDIEYAGDSAHDDTEGSEADDIIVVSRSQHQVPDGVAISQVPDGILISYEKDPSNRFVVARFHHHQQGTGGGAGSAAAAFCIDAKGPPPSAGGNKGGLHRS